METLNYAALERLGYTGYLLPKAPVRVLQFGEGNFLRAFIDYFIDIANERTGFNGKVTLVQPIPQGGLRQAFERQEGLYTLYLRGLEDGEAVNQKRVISACGRYINPYADYQALLREAQNPALRYVVSNTTEAGIVYDGSCRFADTPPVSFPPKLTRLLYERWRTFMGEKGKGLVILSCELIDDNGIILAGHVRRHAQEWQLESQFMDWLSEECLFCSTLVDRIVTGYPRGEAQALNAENGYIDDLLDTGETFALWVIEGPEWLAEELPFARAGLPVKVVADHAPYKKQKVRILNGAHTSMVPAAFLCGQNIVRDAMYDDDIAAFFRKAVWEEIMPVVPLPRAELEAFANSVEARFKNPFIDHALLSIALNTTSKWRARVLPSLEDCLAQNGTLPPCLAFSLAAMIAFYQTAHKTADGRVCGTRDGAQYPLQEDAAVLDFYMAHGARPAAELAGCVLANTDFWGTDLTRLQGLAAFVAQQLAAIREKGMRAALEAIL